MEDDDDIAAEYDFPDLHRRAKEHGREYRGMLQRGMRQVLPLCDDPNCACYNNEATEDPPQTKEGPP